MPIKFDTEEQFTKWKQLHGLSPAAQEAPVVAPVARRQVEVVKEEQITKQNPIVVFLLAIVVIFGAIRITCETLKKIFL